MTMNFSLPAELLEATRLTKAGQLTEATAALQRMLGARLPVNSVASQALNGPPTIDDIGTSKPTFPYQEIMSSPCTAQQTQRRDAGFRAIGCKWVCGALRGARLVCATPVEAETAISATAGPLRVRNSRRDLAGNCDGAWAWDYRRCEAIGSLAVSNRCTVSRRGPPATRPPPAGWVRVFSGISERIIGRFHRPLRAARGRGFARL